MKHLFFYGVLRPDIATWPFLEGLGPGQPATTRGMLYAIPDARGWYPALTPGEAIIQGMCHQAGDVDLAAIDAFEGADYTRRSISVSLADAAGQVKPAHAYIWSAALPAGAVLIAHGDFAHWLSETGNPSFAEA